MESTGNRFSSNMLAAITPKGGMRFMIVKGMVTSNEICEFLKRLMKHHENKVFLIWDGHSIHKAGQTKNCIASFDGRLGVFLIPPYSPDLNPIEQVWHHAKGNSVRRKAVKIMEQLKRFLINKLRSLQKLPKMIAAFFDYPNCTYIGDAKCL